MMTVLIVLLALVAAGVITELVAASRAPFGYEDEQGFHLGGKRGETSGVLELENPS